MNNLRMKKVFLIFSIALFAFSVFAQKSDLRVLYVGFDPVSLEQPKKGRFETSKQHDVKLLRWDDFKLFLSKEFKAFKQIDRLSYNAKMSDNYDVTIFDALPKPLKARVFEMNPDGSVKKYSPAVYLPEDFSAAALTISTVSSGLGEPIGTKLDWC